MARPRLPQAKAEVSGAIIHDAGRFASRKVSKSTRDIGEPYARMTDTQKLAWADFRSDLPWLNSSHRVLLRLACVWAAKMDEDGEINTTASQVLSSILSKLGATPVDETKVNHGDDSDEDPADAFFGRPN